MGGNPVVQYFQPSERLDGSGWCCTEMMSWLTEREEDGPGGGGGGTGGRSGEINNSQQ